MISPQETYVVVSQYTGFMSSDREEWQQVFGPASETACNLYIRDRTHGDGISGHPFAYRVVKLKITYTVKGQ